ncbi:hypothetical protein [Herbaspirillum sp. RV1423]|uniref:hypothetical protein n=1 Tax=Herbaspirillum sp. RV1423 TaxID=1443993 RepID=UPI0018CC3F0B|nr:hypothetical protein [Herbaspirillum sp. RV1423]
MDKKIVTGLFLMLRHALSLLPLSVFCIQAAIADDMEALDGHDNQKGKQAYV